MDQKLSPIFKNIAEIEPSSGLETAIFRRIAAEKDNVLKRKLLISRLGLGASAAIFLAAIFTFGREILHSEFASVLSLFFSDMHVVIQNWYDFGLSLMETFPTVTVGIILLPLFTLFLSLGAYLDLNNNNQHKYI